MNSFYRLLCVQVFEQGPVCYSKFLRIKITAILFVVALFVQSSTSIWKDLSPNYEMTFKVLITCALSRPFTHVFLFQFQRKIALLNHAAVLNLEHEGQTHDNASFCSTTNVYSWKHWLSSSSSSSDQTQISFFGKMKTP